MPNPRLNERFANALSYTTKLHCSQARKGTSIPYMTHLMAVCSLVLEHGGDEDEAIAALLHDAVEDQGGEPVLQEINNLFGDKVAQIVKDCSDTDIEPKPRWKKRKEDYIAHLSHVTPSVLLVSCCDKLHNANAILNDYREIGDEIWERFNAGKKDQLWYYNQLVSAFRAREKDLSGSLIQKLEATISNLSKSA
ncbi:MAG: HD domain-containing protein [Hyphomicrobiales bacterium]|nr:HD domain-containing protein [Hyphomicrobiales bacterium]